MRFIAYKSEINDVKNKDKKTNLALNSYYSVNQLKRHFFDTLSRLGKILVVQNDISVLNLQILCRQPDVIFAAFHEEPPHEVPCRFLVHSKGSLLLPSGFLNAWTFLKSTCNIVTSNTQRVQLNEGLGQIAPTTGLLNPLLGKPFLANAGQKRDKRYKKIKREIQLVYAGRWIANKGICQAIRALNLWPIPKARLTIIGAFEPDFPLSWCEGTNRQFESFFNKEYCTTKKINNFKMEPALFGKRLSEKFIKSDVFIYPSFHEDENFGMAPREAILCGMTTVVTDFCGLSELGTFGCHQLVKTYPTLAGIRFSLRELREKILLATHHCNLFQKKKKQTLSKIKSESNGQSSFKTLQEACSQLLAARPSNPKNLGWRSKERLTNWLRRAPKAFQQAAGNDMKECLDGLYVEKRKIKNTEVISDPHFRKAISGLYTTFSITPRVSKNNVYRGFWRIDLLPEERAVIEFGYPGPRRLRFSENEWNGLCKSVVKKITREIEFECKASCSVQPLQKLLDFGYIVPDNVF